MVDSEKAHDTKLLYCCNTVDELGYADEFIKAMNRMPLEVIPVIAKEVTDAPAEQGYVTVELLQRRVPDYADRIWYLSGPPPMVNAYTKVLRQAGVSKTHIVRDFFPGLA